MDSSTFSTSLITSGLVRSMTAIRFATSACLSGGSADTSIGYAKDLLEKALGAEKALDVIGKLTASLQVKPFEFVRKTDATQLLISSASSGSSVSRVSIIWRSVPRSTVLRISTTASTPPIIV